MKMRIRVRLLSGRLLRTDWDEIDLNDLHNHRQNIQLAVSGLTATYDATVYASRKDGEWSAETFVPTRNIDYITLEIIDDALVQTYESAPS